MKIIVLLFVCAAFFAIPAGAQNRQTIRIKPGADAQEMVQKELYRYPQFRYGKVYFNNGDVSGAKMNYDLLSAAVVFIDASGDTLAVANETAITYANIGEDTFYYDQGFLEKVAGTNNVTIAVKRKLSLADVQKVGAFGISSSTTNIESKESYRDRRYQLGINEELVFTKQTSYYIRKGNSGFVTATRKNLLKLFPKEKTSIESYLD
jgi:hypothetical protein